MLSLLQMWTRVEPEVRDYNLAHPDAPIVPWVLVAENHYRSFASGPNPQRPLETHVPFQAFVGNRTLSAPALEQMAVVAMQGADPAHPQGHVVVVAPRHRPAMEAPLGWVLSDMSRSDLDCELERQRSPSASRAEQELTQLAGQLAGRELQSPSTSNCPAPQQQSARQP